MTEKIFTVLPEHAASVVGSGGLEVLATPSLIAFMEIIAFEHAQEWCRAGETTVGSAMDMKHLAPTAIGKEVIIRITEVIQEKKRINYVLEAFEGDKEIGRAKHMRVIVTEEEFMSSVE